MAKVEKELVSLVKSLSEDAEKTTKELGKKSLKYMQKLYGQEKNNLSSHISNIKLRPYNDTYKDGFVISSGNDDVAVFNEFGTGIVGEEKPNPLAADARYKYNMNSPHKGVIPEGAIKEYGLAYCEKNTDQDTWWYHKNGKWWHTKGMKPKNMYASLVDKLKETGAKDFKVAVNKTIENYNGR